jgi:hypothetical protein
VILLGTLLLRPDRAPVSQPSATDVSSRDAGADAAALARARPSAPFSSSEPAPDPREIVAGKVSRFAHDRLSVVQAMAKHYKVEVPKEVEPFFAAVETGRWEEVKARFGPLKKLLRTGGPEAFWVLSQAVQETYGLAEAAQDWPAQKLLDYAQAVLGSLRPGMVYVGGTDAERRLRWGLPHQE